MRLLFVNKYYDVDNMNFFLNIHSFSLAYYFYLIIRTVVFYCNLYLRTVSI